MKLAITSLSTRMLIGVLFLAAAACRPADAPAPATPATGRLTSPPPRPQLMFVSVASDDTFRKMAVASLAAPAGDAFYSSLSCERVYFGGNRGLCLTNVTDGGAPVWSAQIFDE